MITPHGWRDCRPTLLHTAGHTCGTARAHTALQAAWARLSDNDKAAFHRFTCLNRQDPAHRKVITNFRLQYLAEIGEYHLTHLVEEFSLPLYTANQPQVISELTALGAPVVPITMAQINALGHTPVHVLMRKADAGDDLPYLALAARRQTQPCSDCQEECWVDPLSIPAPGVRAVCIACARWALHQTQQTNPPTK